VHFVDQVDLEAADDRLVDRLVEQARDFLDTSVRRCGVELSTKSMKLAGVAMVAGGTRRARAATGCAVMPAGCRSGAGAVERFGEGLSARSSYLASPARSGEEISVVQAPLASARCERLTTLRLPHQWTRNCACRYLRATHGGRHPIDSTGRPCLPSVAAG
jgi:hypothetical protein